MMMMMAAMLLVIVIQVEDYASSEHECTVEAKIDFLAYNHWDLRKDVVEVWSTITILLQEINLRRFQVLRNTQCHSADQVEPTIAQCTNYSISQELRINAHEEVESHAMQAFWIFYSDGQHLFRCRTLLRFRSIRILLSKELKHVRYGRSTEHSFQYDVIVTGLLPQEAIKFPLQIV